MRSTSRSLLTQIMPRSFRLPSPCSIQARFAITAHALDPEQKRRPRVEQRDTRGQRGGNISAECPLHRPGELGHRQSSARYQRFKRRCRAREGKSSGAISGNLTLKFSTAASSLPVPRAPIRIRSSSRSEPQCKPGHVCRLTRLPNLNCSCWFLAGNVWEVVECVLKLLLSLPLLALVAITARRAEALGVTPLVLELRSGSDGRTAQIVVNNDSAASYSSRAFHRRVEIDEDGVKHRTPASGGFCRGPADAPYPSAWQAGFQNPVGERTARKKPELLLGGRGSRM